MPETFCSAHFIHYPVKVTQRSNGDATLSVDDGRGGRAVIDLTIAQLLTLRAEIDAALTVTNIDLKPEVAA